MKAKLLLATALAGPLLLGTVELPTAQASTIGMQEMKPATAGDYAAQAAASDLFEIQSSRLALERSRDKDVRAFAQMMVEHHTRTTEQLKRALGDARIPSPAPRLMPAQQTMMTELRAAPGDGFDRLYMSQQRMAHEMALALHKTYAERGDAPALRNVAAAAVPVIEQHIRQLRTTDHH